MKIPLVPSFAVSAPAPCRRRQYSSFQLTRARPGLYYRIDRRFVRHPAGYPVSFVVSEKPRRGYHAGHRRDQDGAGANGGHAGGVQLTTSFSGREIALPGARDPPTWLS